MNHTSVAASRPSEGIVLSLTALAAVLLLRAGPAVAQPQAAAPIAAGDADAQMAAGLDAYRGGDFAAAIAAFHAAFKIDARPAALFAVAQAERMAGDCATALVDYDLFLASGPVERAAAAARAQRAVCAAAVAATTPEPVIVGAPVATPALVMMPPPPPPPARPPWWRDPIADGLLAATVGAGATGLGFTLAARGAVQDGDHAPTYAARNAAVDRAARDRLIAVVAWSSAGVLAAATAWRLVRRPERAPRGLALVPGPGLGVAVTGGF
jgi:tetratricopeptide (TPR) repeat protein